MSSVADPEEETKSGERRRAQEREAAGTQTLSSGLGQARSTTETRVNELGNARRNFFEAI